PPATTQQVNPAIKDWDSPLNYWTGNSLGGNDPNPTNYPHVPLAKDRLLNHYIAAREAWRCPADQGFGAQLHPTTAGAVGNSYRFNWNLEGDYYSTTGVAEDPDFNLGLKKESWVPEPARFIMFYDMAVYPYASGISQWHNTANPGKIWDTKTIKSDPEKFVGSIGFVDSHVKLCDFSLTLKMDLTRGLNSGNDFMWYKPRK